MPSMSKLIVASATLGVVAANTAEISSTNLNGAGRAFDNLKASWGKALSLGGKDINMNCKYDHSACKDFLSEVSFSGDLTDSGDVKVGYEITRDFQSKDTEVKLTADMSDTSFSATYNDNQLQEVGAERDVDVGDQKVNVQPTWLVQAKTARVKMMSALDDSNSVSAQVDYDTDGGSATYEVGFSRSLSDGKSVSATFTPESQDLEIELVDSTFESGATWTATANVGLKDASNVLDSASVTLSRSWDW